MFDETTITDQARLDRLLLQWEERQVQAQNGIELEELRDRPDLAEALKQQIDALQRVDAWLTTTSPPLVPASTRYRELRFHARGGLGEVFVAHDDELHRDVALKRPRSDRALDAEAQRRFVREAEITASLDHPGIVPVLGLTATLDGQPCYAMRLVRGETLHEAIQRFHAADAAENQPADRPLLSLEHLLVRLVMACNTVHHAHSRSVIHRDLKPANILLGPYGETFVIDWGLAKRIAPAATEAPTQEGTQSPSDLVEATVEGKLLGTPSFMSPEQASGNVNAIGPTSDIYSLGATLYTLLTGQAPLAAATGRHALERIQRGDFPAPRRVNSRIARPLEAICLKAMAQRPEQRYSSAAELAADLVRWLANQPVEAYRYPLTVRLRRWLLRHQTAAGVALLLPIGVAFVFACVGALAIIDRSR